VLCLIKTNLINFWYVPHSSATAVGLVVDFVAGTALAGVREHLGNLLSDIISEL
jgi:hypothetical protein